MISLGDSFADNFVLECFDHYLTDFSSFWWRREVSYFDAYFAGVVFDNTSLVLSGAAAGNHNGIAENEQRFHLPRQFGDRNRHVSHHFHPMVLH